MLFTPLITGIMSINMGLAKLLKALNSNPSAVTTTTNKEQEFEDSVLGKCH
jgi:hypothetical protein